MPISTPPTDRLLLIPDGSGLATEIEAYLATLPPQLPPLAPTLAPAHPTAPYICPLGSTAQPWNAGYPLPRPTLLDRLVRRAARPAQVSVATHLRLASRYIACHGWVQGAMWDSAGRVCLLGAQAAVLAHGYGTPDGARRARTQVMEVLHATGRPVSSPDEYNDAPATRQADIHRLLDHAAARALRLGI
ncbi:hypothetical protein [Kitasatospora sp. MAP5-34]|uniref:DUF6197 family protein n=1 Tax=Kitasatospora sp. MAP5-34 TaxID=3035102 RepID=UPI0024756B1D|nr:hypothetical protein [Kitasatospora sp. MAP5-34]MDH6576709.1 hypothetical protein [Kitasatospora sp. MAP5-34]